MDELVPMKPDKKPAESNAPGVGFNATFPKLKNTAKITEMPNHKANCCWSIQIISNPPAIVPGIRPRMANLSPVKDMKCQCFSALASDNVSAHIDIGAGTYRGSIKKRSGAAIIARPNPIEVCT